MDTAGSILDAGLPPRRSLRRWWAGAVGLVLLVSAVVGAMVVPIPYYAMAPGSALAVDPFVELASDRRYPADGEVFLTTVALRPLTVLGAVHGWLDPAVEVVPEEEVLPQTLDRDDLRRYNVELMHTSQQTALLVAFERLGYQVPPEGDGALVAQVVEGSPAAGALAAGDVVVGVGDQGVALAGELVDALEGRRPGDEVQLSVRRGGQGAAERVTVVLAGREDDPGSPLLGVGLQTAGLRYDFPFEVDIAAERIGGPSAGLAFTLELLDLLSPGELTGGREVAATGTIALDGAIGTVGGVTQKTVAVREAGVELFLVPEALEDEARAVAGDELVVEGVATLDEALAVLADHGGERPVVLGAAPSAAA